MAQKKTKTKTPKAAKHPFPKTLKVSTGDDVPPENFDISSSCYQIHGQEDENDMADSDLMAIYELKEVLKPVEIKRSFIKIA